MSDVAAAKSRLRSEFREKWRGSPPPGIITAQALAYVLAAVAPAESPVVAGFIRHGHEVDVEPLLQELAARGVGIALPRVVDDGMVFTTWDGVSLVEGAYGLLEPMGGAVTPPEQLSAVLAPAMACSLDGTRLGRGGGYYDRALAQLENDVMVIGVVGDDAVLPAGAIAAEAHDVRMHAIATPTRIHPVGTVGHHLP